MFVQLSSKELSETAVKAMKRPFIMAVANYRLKQPENPHLVELALTF